MKYQSVHDKLKRLRGSASTHPCETCNRPAAHWAYDHLDPAQMRGLTGRGIEVWFSADVMHYRPLCRHCHAIEDAQKPTVAWFAGPCKCHTKDGELTGERYP